jgi:SAM-dependent methyltransferase
MEDSPFYRQFYEQAGIRDEDVASEERVPITLAMIPNDISTVLDVGCGDGTMLTSIDPALMKVGLDISRTALRLVKTGDRILASSNALPFKEGVFDLVLCTEVFEHLPHIIHEITVSEIQKVAKKYILLSVPFREDLERKQSRCSRCGYVFHIHLHLRSFDLPGLKSLFPYYSLDHYRFSGPQEKTFPRWLLKIRRKYGRRWEWDKNALCPHCGHKSNHPPQRSITSTVTSLLANLTGKRHPKWVSALYIKQ